MQQFLKDTKLSGFSNFCSFLKFQNLLEECQILHRAIVPDLQAMLTDQMKSSFLSITTDRSNNQGLEKMNPITIRLFYTCLLLVLCGPKRYYIG